MARTRALMRGRREWLGDVMTEVVRDAFAFSRRDDCGTRNNPKIMEENTRFRVSILLNLGGSGPKFYINHE